MQETTVQRKMTLCFLKSFYGEMLTEKEREAAELYLDEDLSLAEIAEQLQVTRQGVHDTLNRAFLKLEEYERKLGLAERFDLIRSRMTRLGEALAKVTPTRETQPEYEKAALLLKELIEAEEQ